MLLGRVFALDSALARDCVLGECGEAWPCASARKPRTVCEVVSVSRLSLCVLSISAGSRGGGVDFWSLPGISFMSSVVGDRGPPPHWDMKDKTADNCQTLQGTSAASHVRTFALRIAASKRRL